MSMQPVGIWGPESPQGPVRQQGEVTVQQDAVGKLRRHGDVEPEEDVHSLCRDVDKRHI